VAGPAQPAAVPGTATAEAALTRLHVPIRCHSRIVILGHIFGWQRAPGAELDVAGPAQPAAAPGTAPAEAKTWAAAMREGMAEVAADGRRLPQVIYASRTHSQLAQVMHELKACGYRCAPLHRLSSRPRHSGACSELHCLCQSTRPQDPTRSQTELDVMPCP